MSEQHFRFFVTCFTVAKTLSVCKRESIQDLSELAGRFASYTQKLVIEAKILYDYGLQERKAGLFRLWNDSCFIKGEVGIMKGIVKFLRVLAGIAVTAGIIFVIVFFVRHSKPVIYDLRAYLDHSITGYDGEAVMEISVNKNGLAEDILPQLKKKDHDAYAALTEAINSGESGSFIDTLFDLSVSETEGLSNGDVVKVRFSYDNEELEHYGIAFTGETEEIPVENLEKIKELDLFADLKLDFAGISPYLTTDDRIFYESGDAYVVCSVTPSDHLKAGDQVTVTIDPQESELPEGTRAAKESQKVTVEGADSFVMHREELTDQDLERIRSQCEKALLESNAFSQTTVIPESEEEVQFNPEEAGMQVANLHFTDQTTLYADSGALDCTEVISQETPDLFALYYECDLVAKNSEADPDQSGDLVEAVEEAETQGADAADTQSDPAAENSSASGAVKEETGDSSGSSVQGESVTEADPETAGELLASDQPVIYHLYGVMFVGHMVRTAEGNLTFRIMNQPAYGPALHLYESQDMRAVAVNECIRSLPGTLKSVS